ncbi:hypothetical protein SUGI_0195110 [Cryptomeria japonica]|uniref:F-box/kelch-repeat protein SKIP25 n=1 Tax=Cryptomeria japonica TaxID=3369 RepID=UPI002408B0FD|nr:F-box/kelch-repeat protein SKIP25 [Cryptomeria japonica]GLJ12643.1 hypothetical protein SUGI_0195110 [Cryptomeria japonica]
MRENEELLPGLPWHLAVQCLARVPLTSLWGVSPAWQDLLYTSNYFQRLRSSLGMPTFDWLYALLRTDDGTLCWFAYDPLALKWHRLPLMPNDIAFYLGSPGHIVGRFHTVQCVSTPGRLILLAGSKAVGGARTHPALDRPLIFEAEERLWRLGAPFRVPRKWCVCGTAKDNKVYVASGCGLEWDMAVSKSAEIYDVEADAWGPAEALGSSKFSGEAISAVGVGGSLHMVSGKGVMIKDGGVYDPVRRAWSKMSPAILGGWDGPCVGMNGCFYSVNESGGRLKAYVPEESSWVTIVESERLSGVSQLAGSRGKICGIIGGEEGEKRIMVVDVVCKRVMEVETPMGCPVAIQVLARMG